jgi:hypothetical protein
MARRLAASLVLALLAVGFVVLRDANRSDAKFTVVSGPGNPLLPIVLHKDTTRFEVHATAVTGPGSLFLQAATYLQRPKDTIVMTVLDQRGAHVARCVFPPSSYTDNGRLVCPLRDISQAHGVLVIRRGSAKIAIYGHKHRVGFLVRDESTSLAGRVSTVLSRIAVPLPNGLGSGVLLISLFGSVALTAYALLCAVPRGRQPRPSTGEPDSTSTEPDAES